MIVVAELERGNADAIEDAVMPPGSCSRASKLTDNNLDDILGSVNVEEIPIPALLRAARGAYGNAIRRELAEGGFEDLPRNGPYVLGGMANRGIAAGDLVRQLGVSKQAASQLVDVLVLRGYLERHANAEDRRKLDILLTERGRAAAAAVRSGVRSVDQELEKRLAPNDLAGFRAGLLALIEIREEGEAT